MVRSSVRYRLRVRRPFAEQVLRELLDDGVLRREARIVAACAGQDDRDLFADLGFHHVTLTNVDVGTGTAVHGADPAYGSWEQSDVHALPHPNGHFDFAWVSDGLHHCRAPHRAVTEMYRVSRYGVIIVESRDSLLMRSAVHLGLTDDYEFNRRLLDTRTHGGVDFGAIPNFVYRWSEREFEKLIRTFDPEHDQSFRYFYGLSLPARITHRRAARMVRDAVLQLAPRQGNTFAMVALRGPVKRYLNEAGTALNARVSGPEAQRYRSASRRHSVVRL